MDIIRFYHDYDIPFADEDAGHKHCRPGWIQIECPFCSGNPGWHLGYNYIDDFYRCWRCGWHSKDEVISKLLKCTRIDTFKIIKQYKGKIDRPEKALQIQEIGTAEFKYPTMMKDELRELHVQYLENRGFDPDLMQKQWNLKSTTFIAPLDKIDYKWRIIAPIKFQGQDVSFHSRDITGKSPFKYLACPKKYEIVHHRNLVYGIDHVKKDSVIVTEGIFDAWRIGYGAVATFGVEFSFAQINLLSKFKKIFILYDSDSAGEHKAQELIAMLRLKTKAERIYLPYGKDPADLKQDDADSLRNSLI